MKYNLYLDKIILQFFGRYKNVLFFFKNLIRSWLVYKNISLKVSGWVVKSVWKMLFHGWYFVKLYFMLFFTWRKHLWKDSSLSLLIAAN